MKKKYIFDALKCAFPLTVPVLTGYAFLGITYGLLMRTSGFPVWLPWITSLVIYTGSMEFLMTDILLSSFNPLSAFATALMVGARHIFYGISMLEKYSHMGWKKFYLVYTTSDETFAVNYSAEIPDEIDRGWFYLWVSFLDQMYWFAGSVTGSLAGGFIKTDFKGLDFVMTAMFAVIFMNQWFQDGTGFRGFFKDHLSEITGVLCSAAALAVFGPDRFIIPAMVLILVCIALRYRHDRRKR